VVDQNGEVQICLVGGVGKSGTTLLREIFSRHPLVATFPTETRFLIDPDGLIDFYDGCSAGWSPYVYDMKLWRLERLLRDIGRPEFAGGRGRPPSAINVQQKPGVVQEAVTRVRERLKASPLLPRYFNVSLEKACPEYPELVDELITSLVAFQFTGRWTGFPPFRPSTIYAGAPEDIQEIAATLGSFFRDVMACRAGWSDATHVVEDSPFNHISFDRILKLIPDARLVHVHRDPRDVAASMTKMVWAPSDPVTAARLCSKIMREWDRVKALLPANSYMEVAVESLSGDPEPILRKLCDFWELPWADELLDLDVSMVNSGRWKRDLDERAQQQVAELLDQDVQAYGYASPLEARPLHAN
jgi:Sulfotransferase family